MPDEPKKKYGRREFYAQSGMWARYKQRFGQPGESDSRTATRTNFWEKYKALGAATAHPNVIDEKVKGGKKLTAGEHIHHKVSQGKKLTPRQQRKVELGNQLLKEMDWKRADDNSLPGDTPGKNRRK